MNARVVGSAPELRQVEDAAAMLGVTPARLRGFILRNDLHDPIGDLRQVYDDWRLRRITDHSTVVQEG